jgi:adenosine deaminase
VAGLSKAELFQLAQDAVEFVFAGDELKRSLRELFERVGKELTT